MQATKESQPYQSLFGHSASCSIFSRSLT